MTTEELIAEARRLGHDYEGWECDGSASVCDERLALIGRLADALEATTRERAAVPDAAPDGQVIIPIARIHELRAAKDAALAAIERVRALIAEWQHEGPSGPFPDRIAIDVGVEVIEPLLTALDGAPEPEWEWEYGLLNPQVFYGGKLQGGARLISDNREHILKQQQRGHPSIQAVRRRKAGPWRPVEGEKP